MKQRILMIGGDPVIASAVHAALLCSTWATPVHFPGPPAALSAAVLSDIDAVFNGTSGNPSAILANAEALQRALQVSATAIRVVHLSSMTVYGSLIGNAVEDAPLRPDIGAYGAAHIEAESVAARHANSVILRPGCEYGPGCVPWSVRIGRLLRAHRLGDLGSAGDGICNLLYLDDLTAAVLAALRRPDLGGSRINLGMRDPPTWNEYLVRFARELKSGPVARLGARRLKIESRLLAPPLKVLEMLERRLGGVPHRVPPAITPSLLNVCGQNITLDVANAERLLDMRWTPLNGGLQRAASAMPPA